MNKKSKDVHEKIKEVLKTIRVTDTIKTIKGKKIKLTEDLTSVKDIERVIPLIVTIYQEQQDKQVEELNEVFDNHEIDYTTSRKRDIQSIKNKIDKISKVKK